MTDDKEYMIMEEGNSIVKRLKERYPKPFWHVVPENIVVIGITNRPRPFSMKKLAKITKIDSAHRTIIRTYGHKDVQYLVELYCSDWVQWSQMRRQWILAHEISHVPESGSKGLIQHDCQDWAWLLDAVGIDWWSKDNLPNLLEGEPFPFRQELFDRLHVKGSGDDNGEGIEDGGDSHGNPRGYFQN